MSLPPAGWYPDPELVNTRRYWDGEKWTEHRQEKSASHPPAPAPASEGLKGFFNRRVTAGVLLLVAIIAWFVFKALEDATSPDIDTTYLETELTSALVDEGYEDVDLTCSPVGGAVEQGDETVCDGTTKDGEISVLVTFNSDGSYIWRVQ